MTELLLPPAYRMVRVAPGQSAAVEARAAAARGVEEGAIFWSDRHDRLDVALLLWPDRTRRDTLPVIYVAALAFADSLGAFAPPPVSISFVWPGGILIDGALAGGVSLACAPSAANAIPQWAVLEFNLAIAGNFDEPGQAPYHTSIAEEDFEGFSVAAQIEGFSRHFLAWLGRWEREGLEPIAGEWSRRAFGTMRDPTIDLAKIGRVTPKGLDPQGNLRVHQGDVDRVLPLEDALADWAVRG